MPKNNGNDINKLENKPKNEKQVFYIKSNYSLTFYLIIYLLILFIKKSQLIILININ